MNQIDPKTGVINFDIGRDSVVANGHDSTDFAALREVENSAHYYVKSASEYVSKEGEEIEGYLSMQSPPVKRRTVRYTRDPLQLPR